MNSLQTLPLGNNMLSALRDWVGQFAGGWVALTVKALLSPVVFGVCALIVDRDGKVLLARHSYMPGWSIPGGGVKRGEPPEKALLREMGEELGTLKSDPPVFFGLYTKRGGWATNVVAVYRLMNAEVEFRRNLEVRAIQFVDPRHPPDRTSRGTRRRLAEFTGEIPTTPFW